MKIAAFTQFIQPFLIWVTAGRKVGFPSKYLPYAGLLADCLLPPFLASFIVLLLDGWGWWSGCAVWLVYSGISSVASFFNSLHPPAAALRQPCSSSSTALWYITTQFTCMTDTLTLQASSHTNTLTLHWGKLQQNGTSLNSLWALPSGSRLSSSDSARAS